LPGSITASYDQPSGVLTLSKTAPFATLAEFQQRSSRDTYTIRNSSAAACSSQTISFFAVDEAGLNSVAATRTLTITLGASPAVRSEERRVGKECSAAGTAVHSKQLLTDGDAPATTNQITSARVQATTEHLHTQDV